MKITRCLCAPVGATKKGQANGAKQIGRSSLIVPFTNTQASLMSDSFNPWS